MRHPRPNYLTFCFFLLWICAAVSPANAETVDQLSYAVVVSDGGYGGFVLCSSSNPCPNSGPSTATASIVLPPSDYPDGSPYSGSASAGVDGSGIPSVGVAAAVNAVELEMFQNEVDPFTFTAGAGLNYFFELTQIAGDPSSGAVPVLMNGTSSLSTQVSDTDNSTSSSVSMLVTEVDNSDMLYNLPGTNNSQYGQTLQILPNVEYEVMLGATVMVQVSASLDSEPSLAAYATVDPTFTVDPAYADDYTLAFSDSIGTVTPEPATWATMLLACIALRLPFVLKARSPNSRHRSTART